MPFKSRSQSNLCYWLREQARKKGEELAWDCEKWSRQTDYTKLPYKTRDPNPLPKRPKGRPKKIYIGPRGGRYYLSNGRKVYIKDRRNRGQKPKKGSSR